MARSAAKELDEKFLAEICDKRMYDTRPINEMDCKTVWETFGLTSWPAIGDFVPSLKSVTTSLPGFPMRWIEEALGAVFGNWTARRMRLDAPMFCCLMAERQDIKAPNQLKLTLDTTISVVMKQSAILFIATGNVDYASWYNFEELRSNLVVVAGSKRISVILGTVSAICKAAGHTDAIISGVASDGSSFIFPCLDNNH
ncbi:hypothetical protein GB937_010028 [Aspergillus fischeri]|nr:hypothetical protein GB937_010028 [Aspergillus fischeri]